MTKTFYSEVFFGLLIIAMLISFVAIWVAIGYIFYLEFPYSVYFLLGWLIPKAIDKIRKYNFD